MQENEKQLNQSEIENLERERERELERLSEKALEIFEKNLLTYEKFDDETAKKIARKWGFDKIGIEFIRKEIDEICFLIGNTEEEFKNSKFELGILDPDYKKYNNLGIHARISACVEEMLGKSKIIDYWEVFNFKGILCENNNGLRYLITTDQDKSNDLLKERIKKDVKFARKIAEMLERYKISQLFLGKLEHIEEMGKRVWDAQMQAALQGPHKKNVQEILKKLREERRTGD